MTRLLKNNPQALAVFDAMREVIEAPGFTGLQRFKDDFYIIDKEIVFDSWHPKASYLWVVRDNGTHLALIGATSNDFYELDAAIELCPDSKIFLVSEDDGVELINQEKYKQITHRTCEYKALHTDRNGENGKIFRGNKHIASFRQLGDMTRPISVTSANEDEPLCLKDIQAIRRIALKERLYMTQPGFTQSAFVKDVDGMPIGEALDQAYEREFPIEFTDAADKQRAASMRP